MSDKEKELDQLKFIASMFRMTMEELDKVMGPESIQTIFRLIGERRGKAIENRMRDKFNVDEWTPELFAEKFVEDVLDPALGKGQSDIKVEGNQLTVSVRICPFKRAGIDISEKFYCTYTEGLIDETAKNAFGNIKFQSEDLISEGNACCVFKIEIQ
ncbi:MAG: hypothetical protein BAJALOKI3v1_190011 [Promethearchaeota archaeon]|nr:MAG: hypothetical protein BAJALOKI3v1_190011 [Candidatus Lokiarchaeota archaeon]